MALLYKPSDVTATAQSPYSIFVEWFNNDDYDIVEVWRKIGAGDWDIDDVQGQNYLDSGLAPSTLHTYRLKGRAYEPPNESAFSEEAYATTYAEEEAPSDLIATPLTDTEVEVVWKVNSATEDSIVVQRSPDVEPREWTEVSGSPIAAGRDYFKNTGLTKGQKYWWRVGLKYGENPPTEWSNEDDATTISEPSPPSALAISEKEDKRLRLTWTDNSDNETGFKIEQSGTGNFTGEEEIIATIGADITDFLVRDLIPNTPYWFRICAYNAAGDSVYSNTATDTTLATYVPTEFEKFIRKPGIKIVGLCEMELGKKLTGFALTGGKTYTYELAITDRAIVDFEKVYEDGDEYTEKISIDEVEANAPSFWFNTSSKTLYVHTSTGANPSGFYIEGRFWLHIKSGESATFNGNFYYPLLSLENIPSMSSEVSAFYGGSFRIASGTISLKNDEETSPKFFDKRYADYLWRGGKLVLKIGGPDFTYVQYKEVFTSLIDRESCNDKLFSLSLKDLRANLTTILVNKYWKTEFPKMDEEQEGKVIPRAFGYREDIASVCIDTELDRWKFHDGRISEVHKVFVNDVEKTKDTDFYVDYKRGVVTFDKSVGIEWEKDIVKVRFTGTVDSALEAVINHSDVFKYIMNNIMGLSNDELDHDSIYETKYAFPQNLSVPIYKEESLAGIIHKIENSARASTFQDEKGRIGLQVAQTTPPSNVVYVENFHISEDGHSQEKGSDFLFKEINVFFNEDLSEGKKKWEVFTKPLSEFVWKYGKRKLLKSLDIYTYFTTSSPASALADDIATKLEQLEKGFIDETLKWMLYGCRAGGLIKLSKDRFFSESGTADEITVRLLKLDKMISSKQSTITGVVIS